ncbi:MULTISPECIES: TadE/TadG family type IV pilus assembly protein [unclassified Ruegeria]|uniref:TadE/TadG family type IV pilus assembly protein n=1 Tax=unclassified Ruegeria TaxID=2625375 RepID=UPI0014881B5B|nr:MULTISPECIES: TadE family protein [unclassified Ruegeria]
MRQLAHIARLLCRQERGAALVELAIVIPIFLFLIFGVIDYGRLYWSTTAAQKAMQTAARLATVGPPLCGALPPEHEIASGVGADTRFGTLCRTGGLGGICVDETNNLPDPCTLADVPTIYTGASDTQPDYADRIWAEIGPLLPPGSTRDNVQFTYSHDWQLGFLGGPYTPVVTADLVGVDFNFVMPLAGLAALAGGGPAVTSNTPNSISLPAMSTSVPAEDLAVGAVE